MRYSRILVFLIGSLAGLASSAAEIITVGTVQLQGKAVLGGTVIPYKEVTLAAQIPGRVEFIAGEEGDMFDAGKTLVGIDDDDLLAKRNAVLAQMANADASLRNTYVQYSRELYSPRSQSIGQARGMGMGMPSMFDQMVTKGMGNMMGQGDSRLERHADLYRSATGINQAQSAVLQARSQLEEIDAALRDARSIAPFEGVILAKMIEVGDTVQPGQPLLSFGHVKYLRIQAEVPATLVKHLRIGMFVPAYLDTTQTRVDARVAQIYPQADPSQHTVTVKFDLPTTITAGPGMYAEVMVPNGQVPNDATVVIPSSALIRAGSLPGVLVVTDKKSSELRLIRLGPKVGAQDVTILSGLRAGERIINRPPPGASSGWMPGLSNQP
ncbi:MAG: efflux RND transporter periplasmic adaptor subunit [Gammaproteobacteria bacterium]|nr:efflux RND transporter periplasmic adaptor subunit [Gammaproteobacteria bacterium]